MRLRLGGLIVCAIVLSLNVAALGLMAWVCAADGALAATAAAHRSAVRSAAAALAALSDDPARTADVGAACGGEATAEALATFRAAQGTAVGPALVNVGVVCLGETLRNTVKDARPSVFGAVTYFAELAAAANAFASEAWRRVDGGAIKATRHSTIAEVWKNVVAGIPTPAGTAEMERLLSVVTFSTTNSAAAAAVNVAERVEQLARGIKMQPSNYDHFSVLCGFTYGLLVSSSFIFISTSCAAVAVYRIVSQAPKSTTNLEIDAAVRKYDPIMKAFKRPPSSSGPVEGVFNAVGTWLWTNRLHIPDIIHQGVMDPMEIELTPCLQSALVLTILWVNKLSEQLIFAAVKTVAKTIESFGGCIISVGLEGTITAGWITNEPRTGSDVLDVCFKLDRSLAVVGPAKVHVTNGPCCVYRVRFGERRHMMYLGHPFVFSVGRALSYFDAQFFFSKNAYRTLQRDVKRLARPLLQLCDPTLWGETRIWGLHSFMNVEAEQSSLFLAAFTLCETDIDQCVKDLQQYVSKYPFDGDAKKLLSAIMRKCGASSA